MHARHRMRDLRVDAAGAAMAVLADGPDGPCVRATCKVPIYIYSMVVAEPFLWASQVE